MIDQYRQYRARALGSEAQVSVPRTKVQDRRAQLATVVALSATSPFAGFPRACGSLCVKRSPAAWAPVKQWVTCVKRPPRSLRVSPPVSTLERGDPCFRWRAPSLSVSLCGRAGDRASARSRHGTPRRHARKLKPRPARADRGFRSTTDHVGSRGEKMAPRMEPPYRPALLMARPARFLKPTVLLALENASAGSSPRRWHPGAHRGRRRVAARRGSTLRPKAPTGPQGARQGGPLRRWWLPKGSSGKRTAVFESL